MKHSRLGNTGLYVSEIALGAGLFAEGGPGAEEYGLGHVIPKEAERIVSLAIDGGINLFDTAHIYCEGQSEINLGKVLGTRRQDIVIATKGGVRNVDGVNKICCNRLALMQDVETSLQRLKTDWIDLYQVHVHDFNTPMEETLRAMDDLVRQGKVRYIGLSNVTGWQIAKAAGLSNALGLSRYCSVQVHYTPLCRGAERDLLPAAVDFGLGALIWSPVAKGFLTDRRRAQDYSEEDVATFAPLTGAPEKALAILSELEEIAAAHSASVSQVTLAWTLAREGVNSVISGPMNTEELQDSIGATAVQLSKEDMERIDKISQLSVEYPGFAQFVS